MCSVLYSTGITALDKCVCAVYCIPLELQHWDKCVRAVYCIPLELQHWDECVRAVYCIPLELQHWDKCVRAVYCIPLELQHWDNCVCSVFGFYVPQRTSLHNETVPLKFMGIEYLYSHLSIHQIFFPYRCNY